MRFALPLAATLGLLHRLAADIAVHRLAQTADVLARIADMPLSRLPEFLPWNWAPPPAVSKAA